MIQNVLEPFEQKLTIEMSLNVGLKHIQNTPSPKWSTPPMTKKPAPPSPNPLLQSRYISHTRNHHGSLAALWLLVLLDHGSNPGGGEIFSSYVFYLCPYDCCFFDSPCKDLTISPRSHYAHNFDVRDRITPQLNCYELKKK